MPAIDVSSSEITPHPGEASHHLRMAADLLLRLARTSEARGDVAGAQAWRDVAAAASAVVPEVANAQERQTYGVARECCACHRKL